MEEILKPSQVAALLQIHVKTVYRLAEDGAIPGNKIGRNWRFSREEVMNLVSRRQKSREKKGVGRENSHRRQRQDSHSRL